MHAHAHDPYTEKYIGICKLALCSLNGLINDYTTCIQLQLYLVIKQTANYVKFISYKVAKAFEGRITGQGISCASLYIATAQLQLDSDRWYMQGLQAQLQPYSKAKYSQLASVIKSPMWLLFWCVAIQLHGQASNHPPSFQIANYCSLLACYCIA